MKTCYTYIVECRDGSLYTGWTTNLEKRVEAHNAGRGAKYTKSRRPVRLRYYEQYETKEEAMRREAAIKRLSRQDKLNLFLHGSDDVSVHTDKMTDAAQHDEEMKDLMGAKIGMAVIK